MLQKQISRFRAYFFVAGGEEHEPRVSRRAARPCPPPGWPLEVSRYVVAWRYVSRTANVSQRQKSTMTCHFCLFCLLRNVIDTPCERRLTCQPHPLALEQSASKVSPNDYIDLLPSCLGIPK